MTTTRIFSVFPDCEVHPDLGIDSIEFSESNAQSAKHYSQVFDLEFKFKDWKPCRMRYEQAGNKPIESEFHSNGSALLGSNKAKSLFSRFPIDWLPVATLDDCPAYLKNQGQPELWFCRFREIIQPHERSVFEYFPGTESICDIIKLVLEKSSVATTEAFRLKGDPITYYVTNEFIDVYKKNKMRGLEFTPVPCSFV